MYTVLLFLHSIFRWLVPLTLVLTIIRAYLGWKRKKPFSKVDDAWRHWTATIAHFQLIIGVILYIKSPITKYFWGNLKLGIQDVELTFFNIYHAVVMLLAIVILTIASAVAKRKLGDEEKNKMILVWYTIVLVLILIAIPWPFHPLAQRPLLRGI